jgi:hypothetical protein
MSITDYLTDSLLILLVVRQLRTANFDRRAWLIPIVAVVAVGQSYLHGVPTHGHSFLLVVLLAAFGVLLGSMSALATRVWYEGGQYAKIRAGVISAGLWILGMGGRMAFAIWASHGGESTLATFSAHHGITDQNAWTAALVLMALGEVAARVGILAIRAHRATHGTSAGSATTISGSSTATRVAGDTLTSAVRG